MSDILLKNFETVFPKARFRYEWMNRLAALWQKLFWGGSNGMLIGISNVLIFPENYALFKLLDMRAPALVNEFFLLCLCVIGFFLDESYHCNTLKIIRASGFVADLLYYLELAQQGRQLENVFGALTFLP